nr:flagellar basal body rod protein FlgB [Amorphus orientalis]
MEPIHLFGLAGRHAEWAATRQATITANIANANTPGFEAKDIEPFESVLDKTSLRMAATSQGHIGVGYGPTGGNEAREVDTWDVTHSGNSVRIDQELAKANETSRAFTLDTSIVRSFHRMIMTSLRSTG